MIGRFFAAMLLLAGCGAELDDGRGGGYGPQAVEAPVVDVPDAAVADARVDAAVDVPVEAFLGVWAHRYFEAAISELPALGPEPTRFISLNRVVATLAEPPGTLALTTEVCAVIIERDRDIVITEVPQSFIDALEPTVRPATVAGDRLDAPWFTELRGVALDDPDADALPTDPDDPRVLDLDGDGNPGLTVLSTGLIDGEIYVVQRTRTRFVARLDGDTLDGGLEWALEDSVLGADNPVLAMAVPVEPDLAASFMQASRIDAETDCAAIVADAARIFTR
ncbi:MAG: hypothetical protein H6705_19375 [Myxococcales bacterium]|nr:hypothetical protein [Myxococcales bacterium]